MPESRTHPFQSRQRNRHIVIKVSDDELAEIKANAQAVMRPMADYGRLLMLRKITLSEQREAAPR